MNPYFVSNAATGFQEFNIWDCVPNDNLLIYNHLITTTFYHDTLLHLIDHLCAILLDNWSDVLNNPPTFLKFHLQSLMSGDILEKLWLDL